MRLSLKLQTIIGLLLIAVDKAVFDPTRPISLVGRVVLIARVQNGANSILVNRGRTGGSSAVTCPEKQVFVEVLGHTGQTHRSRARSWHVVFCGGDSTSAQSNHGPSVDAATKSNVGDVIAIRIRRSANHPDHVTTARIRVGRDIERFRKGEVVIPEICRRDCYADVVGVFFGNCECVRFYGLGVDDRRPVSRVARDAGLSNDRDTLAGHSRGRFSAGLAKISTGRAVALGDNLMIAGIGDKQVAIPVDLDVARRAQGRTGKRGCGFCSDAGQAPVSCLLHKTLTFPLPESAT